MRKQELENLGKDELFEKIKAEYAQKAKYDFVTGIIFGLLGLAILIFNVYFLADYSFPLVLMSVILLVITLEKVLFSLMAKKIMKAENAEVLLSRYDAYTKKLGKCTKKLGKFLPFIAILALFLIGYMIYNMITQINIERFGAVLFWLIIVFLVLCFLVLCFLFLFMMMILVKGNNAKRIGRKDEAIERLRELVNNDQQDTL